MGGVSPVLCRIRCTPFCAGNALPLPAMAVFLQLFLAYDCMNQDTKDNSFKWVPQALMVAAASERPRMPHASSRPPPDATSFIVFATAAMASQFSRAAAPPLAALLRRPRRRPWRCVRLRLPVRGSRRGAEKLVAGDLKRTLKLR